MSVWVDTATVGTPLLVAALGLAATIWAKRLSRRTEDANARKLTAEAASIEVQTARGMLDEVIEMMAHQRTEYETRLTATRADLAVLSERTRITEARQQAFMAALVAHAPWDEAAWAALKTQHPTYPPPPPLTLGGAI